MRNVSHSWCTVQFTVKVLLSAFEHSFFLLKFHCFICCFLIGLLPNIAYLEGLSRHGNSISRKICLRLGQFLGKHFVYLHCSGSACSDCNECSGYHNGTVRDCPCHGRWTCCCSKRRHSSLTSARWSRYILSKILHDSYGSPKGQKWWSKQGRPAKQISTLTKKAGINGNDFRKRADKIHPTDDAKTKTKQEL